MYLPYPLVEFVIGKALNARQTYEILEPDDERPPKRGKRMPNPDKQEFTRKLDAAIKETTIEKAITVATKNGKKVPTDG